MSERIPDPDGTAFADLEKTLPYRWDAKCPVCGGEEFCIGDSTESPDRSVCENCGNGVMKWKRIR